MPPFFPRSTLLLTLKLGISLSPGAPILFYDSDGADHLSRIDSETDSAFVTSSDAFTSLGSSTSFQSAQATQSHTVTLGSGTDLQYRFGDGPLNDTVTNSLANGIWLGTSFVAAQTLELDKISFKLWNNSNNGADYAARDVAAFVRLGTTGSFTQFGALHNTITGNGNQGTITFADTFTAFSGHTVEIRFAFTDRTRTTQDGQASTRIGSLEISALAGTAPTLTVNSIAPGSGPVSHPNFNSFTTTFGAFSTNPYFGRGQTFTTADTGDANKQWSVTRISLRSKALRNFGPGDRMRVWFFEWLPSANANDLSNWTTNLGLVESDGLSDGDPLDGTTMGSLFLDGVDYRLPANIANGDYLHFELPHPLALDENTAYGTFFEFIDADGSVGSVDLRLGIGTGGITYPAGTKLRTTDIQNTSVTQDLTFFVTGTPIPGPPSRDLVLASPFQEGMILQRDKAITIWGQALPDTNVSVTINGNSITGSSNDNGDWSLQLPSLSSGGPHTLTVTSGSEIIELSDILIGDVWFAFGQSNMVRPLNEMENATFYKNAITNGELPIRCLKVAQGAATSPQKTSTMSWLDHRNPGSWTSVGAVFAYHMYQATNVPTAIIWSAWGSTSIEGWMPLEMTTQFPHFEAIMHDYFLNDEANVISQLNGSQAYNEVYIRTRPNIVYNQMVHPLLNFGLSGFIWYQGESNAGTIENCAQYGFTLPSLVSEYRKRFGQGDLPFLGVQLPSLNRALWPWFREAQSQLNTIPNGHIAITLDTGSANGNVHPLDKEQIGVRLALLARKYQQSESIEAHGPRFSSMTISANQATISFTNATGLTTNDALSPATFELAGLDQIFHPATSSTISGNTVTISSNLEPSPVAIRYAWSPAPINEVNLVNSDGLPTAPFRTDSWPLPGLSAQAPQAINDSYQIPRDDILTIPASGILANDFDLNQDPLSVSLISGVSFGNLSLESNGSFIYTPDEGYAGPDSFTYLAYDGNLNSSTATVSIKVTGIKTNYYNWRTTIPWNAGDDETTLGDPDGDGVANFLEYALGLDPLALDTSGLPTLTVSGSDFAYDFNNVQAGVTYSVLISTDLKNWSDPAFATLTSTNTPPVIIPASEAADGKLFVRLRISE